MRVARRRSVSTHRVTRFESLHNSAKREDSAYPFAEAYYGPAAFRQRDDQRWIGERSHAALRVVSLSRRLARPRSKAQKSIASACSKRYLSRRTLPISAHFAKDCAISATSKGRNLVIEYRSADGDAGRFADLARELVRLKVDLIVTRGTPAAIAAKNATDSIPTVMTTMGDPRAVVASFAHPGGNITGVTTFSTELTAKRIELLKELVRTLTRIGLLHNMGNPAAPAEWEETKNAASVLGLTPELLDVRTKPDLDQAFELARRRHVDALLVGADGLTQLHQQLIVDTAARYKIPASYPGREFVAAGGLMAYGVNYPDLYFRLARLIDRIVKGAKPGDVPVEQPAKFELVVNLGTVKALGLTVPQSVLLRADKLIE
jgi:putative tryptophan/tyrosine transport system substrate-binding protein